MSAVGVGHDGRCERDDEGGFFLCHCSKREREARGLTEPPNESLDFPPPDCPECGVGLWHDGDEWRCSGCSLSWASSGGAHSARFTDDYGDIDQLVANWRSRKTA